MSRADCDRHSSADKTRFVIGSMSPGTKLPSQGHTYWGTILDSNRQRVRGLIEAGLDAFIFETCKHTIQEMTAYKWAEGTETRDAKDEPLKVNDHTVDALRYSIFGVEGAGYFSQSDLS